jgi:septal ring factor EnvC (AmiA/AmiB activator)
MTIGAPPADLHRDIGRIEGELSGMRGDLTEIKAMLKDISDRVAQIEARENERKGAWWVLGVLAATIGAFAGAVLNHFWK